MSAPQRKPWRLRRSAQHTRSTQQLKQKRKRLTPPDAALLYPLERCKLPCFPEEHWAFNGRLVPVIVRALTLDALGYEYSRFNRTIFRLPGRTIPPGL